MTRRAGMSRYNPLVDHLRTQTTDAATLTLAEIEAMIGGHLPDTAHVDGYWWRKPVMPAVRTWEALGWRAHLDLKARTVTFRRGGAADQA
jgi:hypothetical protein